MELLRNQWIIKIDYNCDYSKNRGNICHRKIQKGGACCEKGIKTRKTFGYWWMDI